MGKHTPVLLTAMAQADDRDLDKIISDILVRDMQLSIRDEYLPLFVADPLFGGNAPIEGARLSGGQAEFEEFLRKRGVNFNPTPTPEQIEAFKREYYADMRRACYPPLADLADALVKDDESSLDDYKAKCRAVKQRFPKP